MTIQLRRDTAANFTSGNPTLSSGEVGFETDTKKIKIGDGSTAWTALGYQGPNIVTKTADATLAFVEGQSVIVMDLDSPTSPDLTLTIPTNASVAFPVNTLVVVVQGGAAGVTVTAASGVTVNGVSAGSGALDGRGKATALIKIATDEWLAFNLTVS